MYVVMTVPMKPMCCEICEHLAVFQVPVLLLQQAENEKKINTIFCNLNLLECQNVANWRLVRQMVLWEWEEGEWSCEVEKREEGKWEQKQFIPVF